MATPFRTIIVTGGIVSGIGKGITAASLGRILQNRGFTVFPVKADPYLNQDAGTMNPFQHGEVFVTNDGAETDLDLGHYERFLNINVSKLANFTSGAVFHTVMEQERDGNYLGEDIQIIPHVTDEIKRRITAAGKTNKVDFLTVEIGGTVGDIEALPFLEAVRQFGYENPDRTVHIHVVKMDYLYPSDEGKTKPIQHAVISVRSQGLQPDILIVRCKRPLEPHEAEKIALFCGIAPENVIPALDADSLYAIPENMEEAGLAKAVLRHFGVKARHEPNGAAHQWEQMRKNERACRGIIRVGLAGKYTHSSDAYLSVIEAVKHAGIRHKVHVEVVAIDTEESGVEEKIKRVDALIVPGGFGSRGVEGKIKAIHTARTRNIPFLGICLGLQMAVVEYARAVAKLKDATSQEFDEQAAHPVIAFLPDQKDIQRKGGTMRLGAYPAQLVAGSLAEKLYKKYRPTELVDHVISERHRHRYEVNPEYQNTLVDAGLVISGTLPERGLVEFIELPQTVHPYFIATQAHPEFRSRPEDAHPLFAGLIEAALKRS